MNTTTTNKATETCSLVNYGRDCRNVPIGKEPDVDAAREFPFPAEEPDEDVLNRVKMPALGRWRTTMTTTTTTRRECNARSQREYALADERDAADDRRGARASRQRARYWARRAATAQEETP
jgi:hypothetical protein